MKQLRARTAQEWERWLVRNHALEDGVWLVFYRKGAKRTGVSYEDAIDSALCYGWVDSMIKKTGEWSYVRKFTPRRQGSVWSKTNVERVERLAKEGRMTEAGLTLFENRSAGAPEAQRSEVRLPPFPQDFLEELKKHRGAWERFQKFAPSHRKRYLMWLTSAKKAETRSRRVREAVETISKEVKSRPEFG